MSSLEAWTYLIIKFTSPSEISSSFNVATVAFLFIAQPVNVVAASEAANKSAAIFFAFIYPPIRKSVVLILFLA